MKLWVFSPKWVVVAWFSFVCFAFLWCLGSDLIDFIPWIKLYTSFYKVNIFETVIEAPLIGGKHHRNFLSFFLPSFFSLAFWILSDSLCISDLDNKNNAMDKCYLIIGRSKILKLWLNEDWRLFLEGSWSNGSEFSPF